MNYSNEVIEYITQEVLKQLAERQNKPDRLKLLALFSGGKLGADMALSQLKELWAGGCQITAVFTPGAERVLGTDWLKTCLPDVEIITESTVSSYGDFVQSTDMIVVPVLTMNTAAKVAVGIADNLLTTILMQGLLQGKQIIAAGEACDPDHFLRPKSKRTSQVYHNRLKENCRILETYGILLVKAAELGREINRWARQDRQYDVFEYLNQQPTTEPAIFSEKVLCMNSVALWGAKVLRVANGTIITPAARDLADERGIEIVTGRSI